MNMGDLDQMNKRMTKKYSGSDPNSSSDEWDIDNVDPGMGWYFSMVQEMIAEHFSLFVLKEMGYHIGLLIFCFGGFAILNYYNNKHDEKIAELQKKQDEELKQKAKKESGKSKFKPKID